jgi:pilus assembly protein CpaB
MTTRRLMLALIIAIAVSGGFTLWFSRRIVKSRTNESAHLQYVVTARDTQAGETLRIEDLKQVNWPNSEPLIGAFTTFQDVVGRTVLYPLASGEPIQERQLAAAGSGAGLSTKVPTGMRAVSLKSDQIVGVAGYLFPGTHVDVLVTYVVPSSTSPVTSTVLQNAEILAAGQKMEPDPKGQPVPVDVVTLLVSPADAERVVLASAQGRVHFVLRNGRDTEQVDEKPVQMSALGQVGNAKSEERLRPIKQAKVPEAPTKYSVQVVSGDKATTESFQ